jgi:hypothetical protein
MACGEAPSARFGASRELVEEAMLELAPYVRFGVDERTSAFVRTETKAAIPL